MNKLYWSGGANFGDALSPVLYKLITGFEPISVNEHQSPKHVAIGSILNHAKPGDTVWGSGLAWRYDKVSQGINIKAVRGPLSRDICLRNGVDCPEIYGDPAMLLPRFFEKSETQYKLGIIPHIVDFKLVNIPAQYKNDVLKIDLTQSIDECIKNITSCDKIVSSSLHGLIAADAYNIPNTWCRFSNGVLGDGTKFADHFLAIGKRDMKCIDLSRNNTKKYSFDDIINHINDCDVSKYTDIQGDELLNACPFEY